MDRSKDWVIWCRSRENDEAQRPFDTDGKEIFSNYSKQTKAKAGDKKDKKIEGPKGFSVIYLSP